MTIPFKLLVRQCLFNAIYTLKKKSFGGVAFHTNPDKINSYHSNGNNILVFVKRF